MSQAKVGHFSKYTGAGRRPVKNVGHLSGIILTKIGLQKNLMPSPASGIVCRPAPVTCLIIISDDWILSAAHCFEPSGYRLYSHNYIISIGDDSLRLSSGNDTSSIGKKIPSHLKKSEPSEVLKELYETYEYEQFHEPEIIISHEDFEKNDKTFYPEAFHDIALIKLKDKIIFNDYIFPACLPAINDFMVTAETCEATGIKFEASYELIRSRDFYKRYKKRLSWIYRPISDVKTCVVDKPHNQRAYDEHGFLSCISNGKQADLCGGDLMNDEDGDLGGPVMCKNQDGSNILRGIIMTSSYPFVCKDYKSLYIDVAAYGKWIHEKTKIPLVTLRHDIETAVYDQ